MPRDGARVSTVRVALAALLACVACEPEPTRPPPSTPAAYPIQPNPYLNQGRGWGQPFPAPTPYAAPVPAAPATPPPHRRIDLTLDVPPPAAASSIVLDVRNPFSGPAPAAREPEGPPLPTTHVLVVLVFDKAGRPLERHAAARKMLSARGAVKRADALWEFPSSAPDRTPDTIRAELKRVLCNEDRASIFFAHDGKLAKVELAGDASCDGLR